MGFFDGLKNVADVGRQMVGTVLDTGSWVLGGAKTLVTDPKKFASDVGDNIETWGTHVGNSIKSGVDDIGEGFTEAREMGNPGRFLWKAVGGMAQIASFGTSDMIKEHVDSVTDVQRDELGNVTSLGVDEKADAITRLFLNSQESKLVRNMNMEAEIKEAIASGDKDRANHVFGQEAKAVTTDVVKGAAKAVGTAATVAGVTVATVATGGAALAGAAPLAAIGAGITAAGTPLIVSGASKAVGLVSDITNRGTTASFDKENVDNDVANRVQSDFDMLKDAGKLTEDQEEMFREVANAYYSNASYMNAGSSLGELYMGEGATNQDFKQWLFESSGLVNPDAVSEQVSLASVVSEAEEAQREGVVTGAMRTGADVAGQWITAQREEPDVGADRPGHVFPDMALG